MTTSDSIMVDQTM